MSKRDTKIFALIQIAFWIGLALFTRWSWISDDAPSWAGLLIYSLSGLCCSTLLAAALLRMSYKSQTIQIVAAGVLAVVMALAARAASNAIEYHLLFSSSNAYEFWGYFHYGRQSVYQMLLWSIGFMLWRHLKPQARNGSIEAEDKPVLDKSINPDHRIAIKDGKDTKLIDPDAIESIASVKDYLCIKVSGDVLVHRATLKAFQEDLPTHFLRCHRSHIVNLKQVVGLTTSGGELVIAMKNGDTHPVSRRLKPDVRKALGG